MRLDEALKILDAPSEIRSNFANMRRWKNSKGRKLNQLNLIRWFNGATERFNAYCENLNTIENNNVKMLREALENMRRANAALPKRLDKQDPVTFEQAQTAMCHGYISGLAKGFALSNRVTDQERATRADMQKAVETLNAELNKLREYVTDNQLVGKSGAILVDSEGAPL